MVPKRLKEARLAAGLSQEKFAALAGLTGKSQISNYEAGRRVASFNFITRLAEALDYPEAFFYTRDDSFANTILHLHRNRNNPEFNPYKDQLMNVQKQLERSKEIESNFDNFVESLCKMTEILKKKN
jgi:transcriptional regulator with XRE-family HTH domain